MLAAALLVVGVWGCTMWSLVRAAKEKTRRARKHDPTKGSEKDVK